MPDSSPALLILYLLGLLGLMLPFSVFFATDYQFLFYLLVVGVEAASAALWYIYIHKTKLFMPIIIGFCVLSILFIIPMWGNLAEGFFVYSTFGSPSGFLNSGAEVLLMPIFLGMAVLVLFSMEFVLRSHTILFLLSAAIVIFGPLINIKPDLFSIILIIIFQFGFYVLNMTDTRQGNRFRTKNRAKTASASVITTAAILLISFIPAIITQNIFEDDLYSGVYQADSYIQDFINNLTGSTEGSVINGNISRGNLRQTGEKMFEAETGEIPQEKLYLVGFNGGDYLMDSWDNVYYQIYEDTEMNYYDPDKEELMSFTYPVLYYREPFINDVTNQVNDEYYDELSEFLQTETGIKVKDFYRIENNDTITGYDVRGRQFQIDTFGEGPNTIRLYDSDEISDANNQEDGLSKNDTNYLFGDGVNYWVYYKDLGKLKNRPTILSNFNYSDLITPIYSAFGVQNDNYALYEKSNTLYIKPTGNNIHTALMPYYSGQQFRGTVGGIQDETTEPYYNTYRYQSAVDMSGQWQNYPFYEKFVDEYIEKTKEYYTDYPADELPRLTQLCFENDLEGVNEVTTFILYTLQTRTRYSTTPGTVPFNKNTIEHFLFDNKRGFCVHYASTAVLMYRMYGIPARYVSGYTLTPDMFTKEKEANDDRTDKSTTLNYHTDVTDHSAHAWVEIFLKDYGWVPVDVTPTQDGYMNASFPGYDEAEMNRIMQEHDWHFRDTSSDSTDNNNNNINDGDDTEIDYLQLLMIFILSIFIAAFVFLLLRWVIIIRKQHTMGCRKSFDRLITLLHFSGLLTEFNGSEKEFAEKLSEAIDCISSEEAEKLIGILETDNYSETPAPDSDSEFVRNIYFKTVTHCYTNTPWYKKLVFRFIKGFN